LYGPQLIDKHVTIFKTQNVAKYVNERKGVVMFMPLSRTLDRYFIVTISFTVVSYGCYTRLPASAAIGQLVVSA